MNRRHKIVLAGSLAVAGLALLNGAKLSEGIGIILVGASLAWLLGSQFLLSSAAFVWKCRVRFVLLTIVGIAGIYGWFRYEADQTHKQNVVYQAKMKPVWDCESRNAQFSNAGAECEKNPNISLQPIAQPTTEPTSQLWLKYSPSHSATRRVQALNDTELTTTEFGSLTCGHIRAGETAVLLADDISGVKIRTTDGQIGWAAGNFFEVVGK